MKKSKKTRILRLFVVLATLIFEILPYGAVCNFATSEGSIRRYYSYFSLVPYGYANFAPLICAVLSCALAVLVTVSLFSDNARVERAILFVSFFAALISLLPLLLGVRFFSVIGAIISLLLFAALALSFNWRWKNE
ncbi:MAG: hypothetical protein IKB02_00135 [Clostridia bacterium]|nr:hypothetical protein [Clostridia bacterium]